jgi:microcystin-dependent protein
MADPFVAEIRVFPFNFAPKGWAWCDGQLLPLSQNTALFSLLGTTYGGNGKSNFALARFAGPRADAPRTRAGIIAARFGGDRRERDRDLARKSEIPSHSHALGRSIGRGRGRSPLVDGRAWRASTGATAYTPRVATWSQCRVKPCARRWRPTAQQHAALPDLLFLYRAARRISTSYLRSLSCGTLRCNDADS